MHLSAVELHRRGMDAANARRFAVARRTLATAAQRTDDPDLQARIAGTVAYVLGQTGEPAAAEALAREVLGRGGVSPATTALLQGQLGTLLMHAGRLDEADEMLGLAIASIESADGETPELANCLLNRSVVRMQRQDLAACGDDLRRAIAVYEAHDEIESAAEARHNLGYTALLGGDLVTALRLMTQSRPVFAATSEMATAISDLDRAEVLRDAGLTHEAEVLLGEVAVRFGAQRMRQARGEAEFHLARSLLRHDPVASARTARAAARRFTALGSTGWASRAQAVHLEAASRTARPPSAEQFAAASDDLARGGFRTEATTLRLAAHQCGRGPALRISRTAPTTVRLRDHEVRAARAAEAGRHADARRIAASGLDLLTGWQQSFGALDLRVSVGMQASELVFTGLSAAAASGRPDVLFEWSERARHMSQQVTPVRPPRDEGLAADLSRLRMLRADLTGADWTDDPRVRALRDRVRERQWSQTSTGSTRERVDLGAVQAHLDPSTAVLAYVYTGSELLCVAVTASGARVVPLSWPTVRRLLDGIRADLDVAALTRGGPMAQIVQRGLDDRLRELDAALLAPVLGDAARAVITLPGILAGIPWAMLPGLHGVPFTLATSVSRWLSERAAPTPALRRDPAVPSTPRAADAGTTGSRRADGVSATEDGGRVGFVAGPRVPRAHDEVLRAGSAWGRAELLTGEAATVDAATALAGRSDLLHVAAHGRHSTDNPLFSGLELADGVLFGYDVDLIPQAPETVILSACELGRSAVRWGEEALGMTRVWLHAGTRCVIAAPVVVADDVAGALLAAVHTGLAAGEQPAEALATAARDTGLRAPFQCHGSGF